MAHRADGLNDIFEHDVTIRGLVKGKCLTPTNDPDLVNKKYVDTQIDDNTYWDRTGTTLKPKTSGDNVDIDGGDLLVGAGTAKIDNISANKQMMISILSNIAFANNIKAQFGSSQDFQMYFDGSDQQFSLTSGEFFFNAGGTTAHSPALGTPALVITDDYNGVSGLSFSNISTGTGADTRFMIKDNGGHYFTFGQPSLTNTATLFGLNRSEIDTIFNAGGTSRYIVIGTLGSKSVYLASNGALRFEVDSGGDIHNNADNKKFYRGAGNDAYDQYNGTDWEFKADNVGSGAVKVLSDQYFSGSGTGLPYGELSVNGNTTSTTISTQNTWYQFTGFDTNGQSNLTTPDHTNDHITITKAGVYKIDFSCSFSGGGGKTYELAIQKNNGATVLSNIHTERKLGTAGDIGSCSATGFCSCSANDTIELWIRCTDVATAAATLRDVNLNLIQVGG